jgi:hypothetical protein
VEFKIKNNGAETLSEVDVTVYFKDGKGNTIAEESYYPVLVGRLFSDSKPLKPNYIWQMERGKFYSAKSVPSEWKEGAAEIRITDLQFEGESTSGGKQELGSTPVTGVPPQTGDKPEAKTELKPAPKAADKPKPPEYRPDQIASLLMPKRDDKPAPPARDSNPKFDANPVDQLLDKRAAAQWQSEFDALRARISACWSPPPGIDANSRLYVVLRVLFKADGSMSQAPTLVEGSASPLGPALVESAKRALLLCQPFTMLKPEHYDQWKDIQLRFDPHELLGG